MAGHKNFKHLRDRMKLDKFTKIKERQDIRAKRRERGQSVEDFHVDAFDILDGIDAYNDCGELLSILDEIANFPDPDFPAGDLALEANRAWKIIYHLKTMAGWRG